MTPRPHTLRDCWCGKDHEAGVTSEDWQGMAPEEQDELIASGWHPSSAAQDQREPPLCESKNCPNRAVGLVTDRNGVQWAACEKHAKDVLRDG